MKVVTMSLEDLLAKLVSGDRSPTDATLGLTGERIKQKLALVEAHKKKVCEAVPQAWDIIWREHIGANHCDHPAHRFVPQDRFDMLAVYNVLEFVASNHSHLARKMFQVTSASAAAHALDELTLPDDCGLEALYYVSDLLLEVGTEQLRKCDLNAQVWFDETKHHCEKRMNEAMERALTGKTTTADHSKTGCRREDLN